MYLSLPPGVRSLAVDLLFYVPPTDWFRVGSVFGPCFAMHCLVFFLVLLLSLRGRHSLSVLLSSFCHVTVSFLWLFHMLPCVGLQYVIVAFSYHTNLLSYLNQ